MVEEGADAVGDFGRENVLELAGLLGDNVGVVYVERIGEETLREAVTADDILRAATATLGKGDDGVAVLGKCGDDDGSVVATLDVAMNVVGAVRMEFDQA